MSAEGIGLKGDSVPHVISPLTVAAARTMETIIRQWARTRWLALFNIVAGAVFAVAAIKLLALLPAAFDLSFLRDVSNTTGFWAWIGGLGAGLAGWGWHFLKGPFGMPLGSPGFGPGHYDSGGNWVQDPVGPPIGFSSGGPGSGGMDTGFVPTPGGHWDDHNNYFDRDGICIYGPEYWATLPGGGMWKGSTPLPPS